MSALLAQISGCDFSQNDEVEYSKTAIDFDQLPGFAEADISPALLAFKKSCKKIQAKQNISSSKCATVCEKFITIDPKSSTEFKAFVKDNFDLYQIHHNGTDSGLLTGYFRPEIKASRTKTAEYKHPIYNKPDELIVVENLGIFNNKAKGIRIAGTVVNGTLKPYFSRSEIENGVLENRGNEIAWAQNPYDLYFMHIQGSGSLVFTDGTKLHLSYNGTNGYGYTSIGKELVAMNEIPLAEISMESIKIWLANNPEQGVDLMQKNKSYVFFKEDARNNNEPIGAQEIELTAEGSIAVDPIFTPLGSIVWVDGEHPLGKSECKQQRLRKLLVAQDVGGAIKGALRGDLYCGSGDTAGRFAGNLKSSCKFYIFTPKA